MFHFLVHAHGWAQTVNSIDVKRVFEYTSDDLIEIFKPNNVFDITRISKIPALFATESGGDSEQIARVGYISDIKTEGRRVNLYYNYDSYIPTITNNQLELLATQLGITDFEFHRTHWAVKDYDLFKIILTNQSFIMNSPKVFSVNDKQSIEEDLLSVMMPFAENFVSVYNTISKTARALNFRCLRADDIWENDVVIQDVVSLISRSRIIICDCTDRNANVFYEAGIAHTLGREVILITQSQDDIPFDLQHLRCLQYSIKNDGMEALSNKLFEKLNSLKTAN